jgi:hypothetical protein
MGKIRNVSGDDLDMAQKDAVVEVPDAVVYSYTASANWEPVDKPATTAHNKGEKDEKAAVAAERGVVEPEPVPEPADG